MNDMSSVIVPKSDQINADTLLAGPMTVTIREVNIRGGQEQPVDIMLEETPLAYRPCKSMSRCLVQAWGPDARAYVGRSLTLYRDPSVKWGGLEVGGIRISHMSDIDGKKVMQLTATKGQRKPHVVMPLVIDQRQQAASSAKPTAKQWTDQHLTAIDNCAGMEALDALIDAAADDLTRLSNAKPDFAAKVTHAYQLRSEALAREVKPDADAGEGYADD